MLRICNGTDPKLITPQGLTGNCGAIFDDADRLPICPHNLVNRQLAQEYGYAPGEPVGYGYGLYASTAPAPMSGQMAQALVNAAEQTPIWQSMMPPHHHHGDGPACTVQHPTARGSLAYRTDAVIGALRGIRQIVDELKSDMPEHADRIEAAFRAGAAGDADALAELLAVPEPDPVPQGEARHWSAETAARWDPGQLAHSAAVFAAAEQLGEPAPEPDTDLAAAAFRGDVDPVTMRRDNRMTESWAAAGLAAVQADPEPEPCGCDGCTAGPARPWPGDEHQAAAKVMIEAVTDKTGGPEQLGPDGRV